MIELGNYFLLFLIYGLISGDVEVVDMNKMESKVI